MCLKPRLANTIAVILFGCVLSVSGIGAWIHYGGFGGLITGVFGILGLGCIAAGGLALVRRSEMGIVIDDTGIDLPRFALFQKDPHRMIIRRADIVSVSKHESLKGRLIEITMTDGNRVLVQARHYCELDDFISHCRSHGIPVT